VGFLKPRIQNFVNALELETLVFAMDAKTGLIKMLTLQMIYVSNMKNGDSLHHQCHGYQKVGMEMHSIIIIMLIQHALSINSQIFAPLSCGFASHTG